MDQITKEIEEIKMMLGELANRHDIYGLVFIRSALRGYTGRSKRRTTSTPEKQYPSC